MVVGAFLFTLYLRISGMFLFPSHELQHGVHAGHDSVLRGNLVDVVDVRHIGR